MKTTNNTNSTISIKDLVSKKVKSGGTYNKDLFKSDNEIIELDEFLEDKKNFDFKKVISIEPIYSKSDNTQIGLSESFLSTIVNDKTNNIDLYKYNIVQKIDYQGEKTISVYRQWLSIKGFTWLLTKTFDKNEEIVISKEIEDTYNLILKANRIELSLRDLLSVAELVKQHLEVSFEKNNFEVKVIFNKDGMLLDIINKPIETKKEISFKSLIDEDYQPSSEDIILKEEEDKKEKENENFFNSFID